MGSVVHSQVWGKDYYWEEHQGRVEGRAKTVIKFWKPLNFSDVNFGSHSDVCVSQYVSQCTIQDFAESLQHATT